jgi:multidrug efflux pump subunit AcrA (membrane-fusion protein)
MSEQGAAQAEYHSEHQSSTGKWVILVLALLFVAGSLYAIFDSRGRLDKLEHNQAVSSAQLGDLKKQIAEAEGNAETLASQLGMTKKELAQRTAQLQAQQRASESRLSKEQQEQYTKVSGEVAGVKTDVTGVKTDVASTRSDLEATKARLDTMKGDMGVMSGLIATTRGDLDVLKHKGDRNYYEFTLDKKNRPTPVSTVSLQLKKTDPKHGKFTLNVMADDRTIEKKDRNVNEPIQFYTGREHMLYEMVVWTVDKSKITGYLSTPKAAPQPVQAGPGL